MSFLSATLRALVFISGIWLLLVFLRSFTVVQRRVFYAYNAPISRSQQLERPETFGYLKNQVAPFYIWTSDNQRLYAWLVAPLKHYLKPEDTLITASDAQLALDDAMLKLIASDEKSK